MKPYYYYKKATDSSYLETINDPAEKNVDKPANEEIPMLLDYLEYKKPCGQGQPQKSHFTNNLIEKMADILINHKEYADYKFVFKLRYDRVITTPKDLIKQGHATKIKSLLANSILQSLQYDSNKHTSVCLFKSCHLHEIKRRVTDKLYKKSYLVV